MEYSEVYDTIKSNNGNANVTITSKLSQKKYKQNLYISSADQIKIRGINSNIAGYNVTNEMCDKWLSMTIIKPRKKKQ